MPEYVNAETMPEPGDILIRIKKNAANKKTKTRHCTYKKKKKKIENAHRYCVLHVYEGAYRRENKKKFLFFCNTK